jgi:NTE family protein
VLALAWTRINWDDDGTSFGELVAKPVMAMARKTIDITAAVLGRIPGTSGLWVEGAYDRNLFHGKTLQDLPDVPRFVFNATSLHTGKLFRCSKPYLADWTIGQWMNPTTRLALAVAASSGFPPVLSPVTIPVHNFEFKSDPTPRHAPLPEYRLTDGGVYDNLGLETVWKRFRTLLVSDGGAGFDYETSPSALLSLQALRVTSMLQDQIGMLRARQMIEGYGAAPASPLYRKGFLASIGTPMVENRPAGSLAYEVDGARALAATKTRLADLGENWSKRLVNWGYILADDRMRSSPDFPDVTPPKGLPYPDAPI